MIRSTQVGHRECRRARLSEKKLLNRRNPTQIEDARGRIVSQLDPLVMNLLRRYDTIPAGALREIVKETAPGWAKWSSVVVVGFVLLAVAAVIFHLYDTTTAPNYRGWGVGTVISCTFQAALALFWPCVIYYQVHRSALQRVGPAMLKHRRCPHCGYDIRGLPVVSEDRATICPECGCAWRLDDDEIAGRLAAASAELSARHKWLIAAIAVLLVALSLAGLVVYLVKR